MKRPALTVDQALLKKRPRKQPAAAEARSLNVTSTPLRAPQAVLDELAQLARAKGISRNQLVLAFVDAGLRSEGLRPIDEIAPGVAAWVSGESRRGASAKR